MRGLLYLAGAVRCGSDRPNNMARLSTLKWPWVGRHWSVTTTLYFCWQTDPVALWAPWSSHGSKTSQYQPGNFICWFKKMTGERMSYYQCSLCLLMLAFIQIYSTQEQNTLRHISQPIFCSTKLSKHCEMYNSHWLCTLLPEILYCTDSLLLLASNLGASKN